VVGNNLHEIPVARKPPQTVINENKLPGGFNNSDYSSKLPKQDFGALLTGKIIFEAPHCVGGSDIRISSSVTKDCRSPFNKTSLCLKNLENN